MDLTKALISIAVTVLAPACAQTGGWTKPVALSTGGQGWESAAAIDGHGDSVAIWDERTTQDQIWSRAKPGAGKWSSEVQVYAPLETTNVFPAVRVSEAGFATAVWTDESGVWTADRPPAAAWNPAQLLAPLASAPIFVMDSLGDALVAWTVGGPTDDNSMVFAVVRPAGGTWSSQQTVATGVHIIADQAGIGETGAAVVTWESYTAVCREGICTLSNFILHAARQNAGSSDWVDSGVLLGRTDNSHASHVALDSTGRAMLVALGSAGGYISATQGATGGAWSSFAKVVDVQSINIVSGMASDSAGNVTMVFEIINLSTSLAYSVGGAIDNNQWSAPVVVSGSDKNVSQIYFALAPNGTALAIWLSSSPAAEIHASIRTGAGGTWGSPAAVSVGNPGEISPEAAAINSAGDAIAIYSGYNASDVHTEYATNFRP
jgi:hypothetical protein